MTYTVPLPDKIPEGTSPYIAEAIRQRRKERDTARTRASEIQAFADEAGIDTKTAAARIQGMAILKELGHTEFRDGVPYYPPESQADKDARLEQRYLRAAMRVYRQSVKARMKRLGLNGAEIENLTRQEVIDRDKSICYLCGKTCELHEIHLDHVLPLSRGGYHTRKNLRVSCATCNLDKGSMTEDEYRSVIRMRYASTRPA